MKKMPPDVTRPDMSCKMGDVWPPTHIKVFNGNLATIRENVEPMVYEKIMTWHRACGLTGMSAETCLNCRHVLVNDVAVNAPTEDRHPAAPSQRRLKVTR